MNQGEIWLFESVDTKARPALILTRPAALAVQRRVTIAGITTTMRSGPTQLRLGPDEGLNRECVANFDDITVVERSHLTRRLGSLGGRHHELCAALDALSDC